MTTLTIVGLDLETTGLDYEKGHRIIEVGMIKHAFDGTTPTLVDKYVRRIHPNRTVPADSIAVHGITLADLAGCPEFHVEAPKIMRFLDGVDLLVGHNLIGFDAPFIAFELIAAGYAPPATLQMFDTMVDARWATPQGKLPNLGELCYALDLGYDPAAAHSAEYDIDMTLRAFYKGLELGWYKLPESLSCENGCISGD